MFYVATCYVIITSLLRHHDYIVLITSLLRHHYVIIFFFDFIEFYSIFRRIGYRYLANYNANVGGIQDREYFRCGRMTVASHQDSDDETISDWQLNIHRVNYLDDVEDFVCKFLFLEQNFPKFLIFVATF